jgi:hypothetical protein
VRSTRTVARGVHGSAQLAAACTAAIEPAEPPADPAPAPAPVAAALPDEPPPPPAALGPRSSPAGRYACRGAIQHVARSHHADLELREDGGFELRFADVSDEGGRSLSMTGTWTEDGDVVVLQPQSGLQSSWSGDAHRHAHGEPSGYELHSRTGVYTHERRLTVTRVAGHAQEIAIDEIGTSVFPVATREDVRRCTPSTLNP